jgi:hypothetical protein
MAVLSTAEIEDIHLRARQVPEHEWARMPREKGVMVGLSGPRSARIEIGGPDAVAHELFFQTARSDVLNLIDTVAALRQELGSVQHKLAVIQPPLFEELTP